MSAPHEPLTVAIVNDYEIVIAGVAALLAPFPERVRVVELDSQLPVISDVDIILYDTFGQVQGDGVDLETLVNGGRARVVVFSWNVDGQLVDRTLARGASGYLSKELAAKELIDAIEAVAGGEVVRPAPDPSGASPRQERIAGVWPGREHGLSAREAEVVALITQGLSNDEIAKMTYLSINSVKTYIRGAYRKIGISRRSQAVIWGMQHGFEPDTARVLAAPPRG
ncbi:MAG: response regulator transcription factor [Actinobacteria bacterium]|jgi:NarL family two-component system response regulator LiaR|nr:response regulator transcription factor [Actinomycetota bacterium]